VKFFANGNFYWKVKMFHVSAINHWKWSYMWIFCKGEVTQAFLEKFYILKILNFFLNSEKSLNFKNISIIFFTWAKLPSKFFVQMKLANNYSRLRLNLQIYSVERVCRMKAKSLIIFFTFVGFFRFTRQNRDFKPLWPLASLFVIEILMGANELYSIIFFGIFSDFMTLFSFSFA
jgi:hypothetical protein